MSRPTRGRVEHALDRWFHLLEHRSPAQLAGIFGAGTVVPWIMFATTDKAPLGVTAFPEILYLAVLLGVLSYVTPRVHPGRTRTILIGHFAAFLSFLLAEFAYVYWWMSQTRPHGFSEHLNHLDAAYLTLGTFFTAGSGIDLESTATRTIGLVQMVLGFGAVAVGIASFVGTVHAGRLGGRDQR
jgi:hypothetical protein